MNNSLTFWSYLALLIWTFFFVCYLIILFQIVADLFRDKSMSGGAKAVWIVCLLIIPLITAVVYLIARGGAMAQRRNTAAQQARNDTDLYIRSVAGTSPADQIATAKQLLDSGAITREEFDHLKATALQ